MRVTPLQAQRGGDALAKARREVRQAVIWGSEVVACTLSSAGGDLWSLTRGQPGFQALVIDEVCKPLALSPLKFHQDCQA